MRNSRRWFPRSLSSGQRVRHPAIPLRHRRGYAVDIHHGLPAQASKTRPGVPRPPRQAGAHRNPARIRRIRAGVVFKRRQTPVPCVYLPVLLTAPGPSGSTEPAQLCRGCSRPPRRPPDQAASSFTPPLRRRRNGGLSPPSGNDSASRRTRSTHTPRSPPLASYLRPGHRPPLRDRLLVALRGPVHRDLRAVYPSRCSRYDVPAQRVPDMEQPPDQRADPLQGPPLVLSPAPYRRACFQRGPQPLQLHPAPAGTPPRPGPWRPGRPSRPPASAAATRTPNYTRPAAAAPPPAAQPPPRTTPRPATAPSPA